MENKIYERVISSNNTLDRELTELLRCLLDGMDIFTRDHGISPGDVLAVWAAAYAVYADQHGGRAGAAAVFRKWADILENPDHPITWKGHHH